MSQYPPRHKNPSERPYARSGLTTTSAVGSTIPKGEAFQWGAAKETALYAVHHRNEWLQLPDDEAVDRIRRQWKGVYDGRKRVGTLVHAVCEAWSYGATVDVTALAYDVLPKKWTDDEKKDAEVARLIEVTAPYIDGLALWFEDWQPEWISTEEVVRHDSPAYIGTRDGVFLTHMLDGPVLFDIKNTAKTGEDDGLYFDSWRMQLCGYARATEILHYDKDKRGRNVIAATFPAYPISHAVVLHLRGDGGYGTYRLDIGDEVWEAFKAGLTICQWAKGATESIEGKRVYSKPTPVVVDDDPFVGLPYGDTGEIRKAGAA